MPPFAQLPCLFAQTTDSDATEQVAENTRWWYSYLSELVPADFVNPAITILVLLAGVVLPVLLGMFLSRALRMPNYNWKLATIFGSLFLAGAVIAVGWPPKLGIDLQGGVILIYEITDEDSDVNALVEAIKKRINPSGVKEVVVRAYGTNQVEIIIPEVNQSEVDAIKKLVATAGFLRFRIVADPLKHAFEIEQAEAQPGADEIVVENPKKGTTDVIAQWVKIGRDEEAGDDGIKNLKFLPISSFQDPQRPTSEYVVKYIIRDAATKQRIRYPSDAELSGAGGLNKWLQSKGHNEVEVLMAVDQTPVIEGSHLAVVRSDFDPQTLNPMVSFQMTDEGSILMGNLTSKNLGDGKRKYLLGIVLDGYLLSAPSINSTISASGQITGQFTQDEVDFLVGILRAGNLPASLNKTPISESRIDPLLGISTIRQGALAIGVSLVCVLIFMLIYYRFSGIVACIALLANLVLILGVMMLVRAAFTLPGLAGLVLTVGMSVDANVLIFERIREEINRGSALRMAIRNGFGRATTTIVDANLTTLITAIVLYAIGTDQIRGFAVTLILGILMSMFTAIFCSRVFFDIGERKRWITKLGMLSIVGATHVDFIGKRKIAAVASAVVIAAGMVGVALRGATIFDIDFLGGSSVHATYAEPITDANVRKMLSAAFDNRQQWAEIHTRIDDQAIAELQAFTDDQLSEVSEQLKIEQVSKAKLGQMSEDEVLELALMAKYGENFRPIKGKVDFSVSKLPGEGKQEDTSYKIDTSIPSADYLKEVLESIFVKDGKSMIESYQMSFADPVTETVLPEAPKEKPEGDLGSDNKTFPLLPNPDKPAGPENDNAETPVDPASKNGTAPENGTTPQPAPTPKTPPDDGAALTLPPDSVLALAELPPSLLAQAADDKSPAKEADPAKTTQPAGKNDDAPAKKDEDKKSEEPTSTTSQPETAPDADKPDSNAAPGTDDTNDKSAGDEAPSVEPKIVSKTKLEFQHRISESDVLERIIAAGQAKLKVDLAPELMPQGEGASDWQPGSSLGFTSWEVTLELENDQARQVLDVVKQKFAETSVWTSSSKIGGKVAGDTQGLAIMALLASLLGIVGYIWWRFQRVVFGLAAVVALVHDVAVTLGAIALSYWLAGALGFLLIEEFKISLPVVAAFLTIIGYSLNDTIVVFDRIREVRGKSPQLTGEMINTSINQTLSRTLLTSITTLLVVLVLYAIGGQGIHAFAFALVVGVMVGTYSSIFVAAPVLLWLSDEESVRRLLKVITFGLYSS